MLVFVVAKKTREELSVFSGVALRAGRAMAGAEARFLLAGSAAWLKPCPDTKPNALSRPQATGITAVNTIANRRTRFGLRVLEPAVRSERDASISFRSLRRQSPDPPCHRTNPDAFVE